jgi:hypothetical protein
MNSSDPAVQENKDLFLLSTVTLNLFTNLSWLPLSLALPSLWSPLFYPQNETYLKKTELGIVVHSRNPSYVGRWR